MKRLIILILISFALVGLGNVFSKSLASESSPLPNSSWAMFKELFH
jgi:hypothetical protein